MSDELLGLFLEFAVPNRGTPMLTIEAKPDDLVKAIEAYISKHYIKKEDVLEAIGEDEVEVTKFKVKVMTKPLTSFDGDKQTRNLFRAEIKEKLNLGE